jgi:hypothetical protein
MSSPSSKINTHILYILEQFSNIRIETYLLWRYDRNPYKVPVALLGWIGIDP